MMLRSSLFLSFIFINFFTPGAFSQTQKKNKRSTAEDERITPALLQSKVKGLLVVTLPDGSHAGTATQMNATAVPTRDRDDFDVRFNQDVGKQMTSATQEVTKFMRVRHGDRLPVGNVIELGFADKHSLKDGPSAAVASALMVNAIITGKKLNQGFAVTGDMTATGEIQPVGGVAAKISGASRKNCTVFAVPEGNKAAISDLYVLEGLKIISEIQIITVAHFDDALAIGSEDRSEEIATALASFEDVRKVVQRNQRNARHPKVLEKLRTVLKVIPNHESARLIALHGKGRGPRKLSLQASLRQIDQAAEELAGIFKQQEFKAQGLNDRLWDNLSRLTKLRESVDKRTRAYLDAYLKTVTFVKDRRERKYFNDGEHAQFRAVVQAITRERDALRQDKSVQEDLLDQ